MFGLDFGGPLVTMDCRVYLGSKDATKAAAAGGRITVWSSGLCSPETSLASILLHATPAEVRYPASAWVQVT